MTPTGVSMKENNHVTSSQEHVSFRTLCLFQNLQRAIWDMLSDCHAVRPWIQPPHQQPFFVPMPEESGGSVVLTQLSLPCSDFDREIFARISEDGANWTPFVSNPHPSPDPSVLALSIRSQISCAKPAWDSSWAIVGSFLAASSSARQSFRHSLVPHEYRYRSIVHTTTPCTKGKLFSLSPRRVFLQIWEYVYKLLGQLLLKCN